jgi:hypothetical protein
VLDVVVYSGAPTYHEVEENACGSVEGRRVGVGLRFTPIGSQRGLTDDAREVQDRWHQRAGGFRVTARSTRREKLNPRTYELSSSHAPRAAPASPRPARGRPGRSMGAALVRAPLAGLLLALALLVIVPAAAQASASRPAPLAFPGAPRSANANASEYPLAGGAFSTAPGVPARSLPRSKSAGLSGSAGGVSVAPLSRTRSATEPYLACPPPKPGYAACDLVVTPPAARLKSLGSAVLPAVGAGGSGLAPADLQSAYQLPSATAGSGQTVALIDAFGDPTAESDLATYRSQYGLGPCSEANGCFRKVNQTGGNSEYPPENTGWALEQSLDVDMVSAVCPNCHILLVEATSSTVGDLAEAENEAVKLGATEISNSWSTGENEEETDLDADFDHPGIPITASSGDSGYDNQEENENSPSYPASSPYVISVGGTVLTPASNAREWSESVWPYSGSGCSLYEPKPAFQSDSGCSHRTTNDVAAAAEGLSVYDSAYIYAPGWLTVGGTSASSPIIAAVEALSESSERSLGPAAFYQSPGSLFNITTGSNGDCVPFYLCTGGGGYNGPTGNGTPDGALSSSASPPPSILTVHPKGTGSATITSTPAGIECPGTCSASFPVGTHVTLTATPQAGSTFVGWSEGCTGIGSCTISLSKGASTTAAFTSSGTPPGWKEQPLAPPSARAPIAPGTGSGSTFYNVSLSADGDVRAKTIFNPPYPCYYSSSSDTGGVYLEEKTSSGWVADGSLTAPALGSETINARWANCSDYGAVTELSGDGSTLLVTTSDAFVATENDEGSHRCAVFVYRHGESGWALDGTLYPPGVGAMGSPTEEGCDSFGIGGAISDDGTRVAVLSAEHVDVFVRETSGWSLEQNILLPEVPGCQTGSGPRQIALSGAGATLLVGKSGCEPDGHAESGRVYAYTRSGSTWSLAQTIETPEPQADTEFGKSIAISADGSTATANGESTGLPRSAGAAWVFEHDAGGWHASTRLTAPTPEAGGYFSCPTVVENGSRIICHASETIGFDSEQGAIYMFERPPAGWTSPGSPPTHLFATEGAGGDELSLAGPQRWPAFAAARDGSVIDATILPVNLVNGVYPNDRIGYEFSTTLPEPPTITTFSPASGAIGSQVTITGTNLRGAKAVSFNGIRASSYVIESATQITAAVPEGATPGPISVTTGAGTATSTQQFTIPFYIATTASGSVLPGEPIYDTARLVGGSSPTGTITFRLYSTSDTECSTPLATLTTSVTEGNDSYRSPSTTESTPGQYQWVAAYSGDANNPPVNSACEDHNEQVIVKAQPSLATTAPSSLIEGNGLYGTATLTGGLTGGLSPTGTITFRLYAASDTQCSTPIDKPETASPQTTSVTHGNGIYKSPEFIGLEAGSYQMVASYSGNAYNAPVQGACNQQGAQIVVVAAPVPPQVLSETSSVVSPTEVTLSGQINTEGQPAYYDFQYGLTTSYGSTTPETPVGTVSEDAAVATTIRELQPGTTYHYRLVTNNQGDGDYGLDQTFTTPKTPALTVTHAGSGSGTVTSSPAGISCPETCFAEYEPDTPVTLTATPKPGSTFVGWEGSGCSGTGTCQVTLGLDKAVTAKFQQLPVTLTVALSGSGSGSVESSPDGIACPGTCSHAYEPDLPVTLTATPVSGSTFVGWSGAGCSGTSTCQVTMSSEMTVTAKFEKLQALNVSIVGSGVGSVESSPSGIACPGTCSHAYEPGTQATLTATAAAGSRFAGWEGSGCSGTGTCQITMTSEMAVTAKFEKLQALNVSIAGSGAGSVESSPSGIACPGTCSNAYPPGTQVTLTPVASAGSRFVGWEGSGCSGTGTCQITMSTDTAVTATFEKLQVLTVSLAGSGAGSVESSPSGIACPGTCSNTYQPGTRVTLTPVTSAGSRFAGWEGSGCSGTGTCQVTMSTDSAVTAMFEKPPVLSVSTTEKLPPATPFEQQLPVQPLSPPASFKAPTSAASVYLAGTRITTTRSKAGVKLTCSGTGTAICRGKLTLAAKSTTKRGRGETETIGTATFSIQAGKAAIIELKLDAAGGALLNADHGRLKATLTALKSSPVPSQSYTESVQLVRVKARGKTKR